MKTRIIHTRIWKDNYFTELNRSEKLLFLYLITNENINMCGIYEIPDKEIIMWTGLTQQELDKSKTKLMTSNKFLFKNGWVKVVNHDKYNAYGNGEKQKNAYEREIANIPVFMGKNTSMDTSMDTGAILDINHKPKNIIHKPENKDQNLEEIKNHYNVTFLKSIKITKAWSDNALEWLNTYSLKEIKTAITKATATGYWAKDNFIKKNGLEFLFRVRNKNGPCDYIGELINFRIKSELDDVINTEDLNDMIQRSKQEDARKHPKKSS